MRTPRIYLDMDGVLADFNTLAREYLGATTQDQSRAEQQGRWPPEQWARLTEVPNFYRRLPKMPLSDSMVAAAKKFRDDLGWDLRVLTAIPKDNGIPDCVQDKFDWMAEHYPGIRIHIGPYSQDKHQHCEAGDILVDDRESNCSQWTKAGGRAVRVHSDRYSDAIAELVSIYQDVKDRRS